jgi:hypothetical protein
LDLARGSSAAIGTRRRKKRPAPLAYRSGAFRPSKKFPNPQRSFDVATTAALVRRPKTAYGIGSRFRTLNETLARLPPPGSRNGMPSSGGDDSVRKHRRRRSSSCVFDRLSDWRGRTEPGARLQARARRAAGRGRRGCAAAGRARGRRHRRALPAQRVRDSEIVQRSRVAEPNGNAEHDDQRDARGPFRDGAESPTLRGWRTTSSTP